MYSNFNEINFYQTTRSSKLKKDRYVIKHIPLKVVLHVAKWLTENMTHTQGIFPHGTCVLLEVNSFHNLTEYFKTLNKRDVWFELTGLKLVVAQCT